jgi:hypothetical protein
MNVKILNRTSANQLISQELPWKSNLNRPDRDYPIVERTRALLEKSKIGITKGATHIAVQHPSLNADSYKDIENSFNWFRNRYIIEHIEKGIFKVVCDRFKSRLRRF